eukprot:gene15055-49749_t
MPPREVARSFECDPCADYGGSGGGRPSQLAMANNARIGELQDQLSRKLEEARFAHGSPTRDIRRQLAGHGWVDALESTQRCWETADLLVGPVE